MGKIITAVLVSIVGFFNSIFFIPHNSKPSPSPVSIVSPTPIQPSEKALKISSFATVRFSEEKKKEFKLKYGDENMSDTELIRVWALEMDSDPALLAQNEAAIQRYMEENGIQYNFYPEPAQTFNQPEPVQAHPQNISGSNDSDYRFQKIEDCQRETQRYNECVQEYNGKMADYSQCLAEAQDPESLRSQGFGRYSSMSCYKPSNYCMKPTSCY